MSLSPALVMLLAEGALEALRLAAKLEKDHDNALVYIKKRKAMRDLLVSELGAEILDTIDPDHITEDDPDADSAAEVESDPPSEAEDNPEEVTTHGVESPPPPADAPAPPTAGLGIPGVDGQ